MATWIGAIAALLAALVAIASAVFAFVQAKSARDSADSAKRSADAQEEQTALLRQDAVRRAEQEAAERLALLEANVRVRPETVQPLPRDFGAAIVIENDGPMTATDLLIEIRGTGDGGSTNEVLEANDRTARVVEVRAGSTRHLMLRSNVRPTVWPVAVHVSWADGRSDRQSADFIVEKLGARREREL